MNILTRRIEMPAWKIGVLKMSMVAAGVLLGSHFHEFWQRGYAALWVFFGISTIATSIWGWQAFFAQNSHGKPAA